MCVYLHVFMKEAGAKPGLTGERWEELNESRQQPGSCEEGETQKVTSYFLLPKYGSDRIWVSCSKTTCRLVCKVKKKTDKKTKRSCSGAFLLGGF